MDEKTENWMVVTMGRLSSIANSLESIAESLEVLSSCVVECSYDSGTRNEFVIRSSDVDVYVYD